MLLAHNGVNHQQQKSSSTNTSEQATEKSHQHKIENPNNPPPVQEIPTTPTPIQQNSVLRSTVQEEAPVISLETATLIPGFGESIFALLIASPFMLLGLKRLLHK